MALKNINAVFRELCDVLTTEGNIGSISKVFSEQSNDADRVEFAKGILRERNILMSYNEFQTNSCKSLSKAIEFRNLGNKSFQKKDDDKALLLYTESIAVAPISNFFKEIESKQQVLEENDALSLAFANRSAVLFSKKYYKGCLADINEALKNNYPNKLKYKVYERQGKCLHALRRIKSAIESINEALKWLSITSEIADKKKQDTESKLKTLLQQLTDLKSSEESDCLEGDSKQNEVPSCSYGKNVEIPCASDCIELKFSSEYGRYIRATRDIQPGDVVAVEKPFTSVLLPDYYKTHCYNCLQRCYNLIPCLYCSTVMYCSEECRTSSWSNNHCTDCPILITVQALELGKMTLLALRIIINICNSKTVEELLEYLKSEKETSEREKGFNKEGTYISSDYSTIFNLIGNTDKRTVSDLFRRAMTAAYLLDYLECLTDIFSRMMKHSSNENKIKYVIGGLLLRHMQSLPCNAHEVSEFIQLSDEAEERVIKWDCLEIGAAAYGFLSLLNHSCDPNVVRHNCQGEIAVLRAIRPIRKDEQILDNYGYHYALHDISERRSRLRNQYYFTCECISCTERWPLYAQLPDTNCKYICDRCREVLSTSATDTNSMDLICFKCSKVYNLSLLTNEIQKSLKEFDHNLEQVISGEVDNWNELAQRLIHHLQLLDKHVQRPWKDYNGCQEAIKQCFAMTGNCYK